jgi:FHS family L-fucose permease-like MFS transporter
MSATCIHMRLLSPSRSSRFFYGQQKPVKTLLTLALLAGAFILDRRADHRPPLRLLHHGGGALQFDHVALYLLAWEWPGSGKYTSQGSAFLIMMILGGAVVPPFQGAVGDKLGEATGMHNSYLVAVVCYLVAGLVLALKLRSVLKSQGLDFDQQIGGGH